MRTAHWTGLALLLLPTVAAAQIPLPTGNLFSDEQRRPAAKKADPVSQAQARLDGLKAQLAAIRELASWASTNRSELANLYSDALANLKQARATIQRAKGKDAGGWVEPQGFEVEPVVVSMQSTAPSSSYMVSAPVVEPDKFYLWTRVRFPDDWVKEKKTVTLSYQIYPEDYLPMATTYQNTANAIFRGYASSLKVDTKLVNYYWQVKGLSLPPGRYFVSAVMSTYEGARAGLVSLGMFRVEGKLLPTIKGRLPHYRDWFGIYNPKIVLTDLKAEVKGKAIQLSGSYKREAFAKGQKPVWIEAAVEKDNTRTLILRTMRPLTAAVTKFGGKDFLIKEHGLAPGTYTIQVSVYTEHPSSDTKWAFPSGSRSDKTGSIILP
jgi:hypothetical protein